MGVHACHRGLAGGVAHERGDVCDTLQGCLSQGVSVCLLFDRPLEHHGYCWNTRVELRVVGLRHDEEVGPTRILRGVMQIKENTMTS